MKRRRTEEPTLENMLRLLGRQLNSFKGESRRSYQKAFSSFQIYVISHYPSSTFLSKNIIADWFFYNNFQGLSSKTSSFYLDKISSLYSAVAHKFSGGKMPYFKEVKAHIKIFPFPENLSGKISDQFTMAVNLLKNKSCNESREALDIEVLVDQKDNWNEIEGTDIVSLKAACAINAGIPPSLVKSWLGNKNQIPDYLNFFEMQPLDDNRAFQIRQTVSDSLKGEKLQWFAMRLRPKVKFEMLLDRFSSLSSEYEVPELFYPMEEIARRVGRKMVWKGRPVIRDVVFFKMRKSEIYQLFTEIYDMAWCYRTPGKQPGNYAGIPSKAMEDFKKALGILGPGFEVTPSGETQLKPGDEVVIVDGDYANLHAEILKASSEDDAGNKIYRVTLLNSNGRWDIGIDARLLKKESLQSV